MQTPLLSLLLNLVLSVRNTMLLIKDLMVDGGCIATIGGSLVGGYFASLYIITKVILIENFK
jgi:hypothetical protein